MNQPPGYRTIFLETKYVYDWKSNYQKQCTDNNINILNRSFTFRQDIRLAALVFFLIWENRQRPCLQDQNTAFYLTEMNNKVDMTSSFNS